MSLLFLEIGQGSPVAVAAIPQHRKQKKPTWQNTLRYSTTSAYSSTSPPAPPSCSLASHPTTANQLLAKPHSSSPRLRSLGALYTAKRRKQVDTSVAIMGHRNGRLGDRTPHDPHLTLHPEGCPVRNRHNLRPLDEKTRQRMRALRPACHRRATSYPNEGFPLTAACEQTGCRMPCAHHSLAIASRV